MGRKKYSKELKARIALDAIKGQKTIAGIGIRVWSSCQSDQSLEEAVT
jgi:transposase-like protein